MTTEEQFEKWQDSFDPCPDPMQYHNAKAAFLAGVQAERERCVAYVKAAGTIEVGVDKEEVYYITNIDLEVIEKGE